jgi:hypothetical protein
LIIFHSEEFTSKMSFGIVLFSPMSLIFSIHRVFYILRQELG